LIPHISKETAYRDLRILCESGEIWEPALNCAANRFEAMKERHCHFKCRQCGNVCDLEEPIDLELDRRIAQRTGLSVSHHHLAFRGMCRDCREEENKEATN